MASHQAHLSRNTSRHSPSHPYRESDKAAAQVAFRFLPVGLAFLVSFLSVLWLTAFRPIPEAAATAAQNQEVTSMNLDLGSMPEDNNAISSIFTDEVRHWAENIEQWSIQFSLDPNLVAVVMQIESCGHPEIHSSAGAQGLFQVMPFHFSEGERPLDPATNAKRGLSYLSRALEISDGDQALALAGYNGGHSVITWDRGYWPDETSRYVYWGAGILGDIRAGLTDSPRLQEWLENGGTSLCNLAAEALDL